jgi:hypothetical protein
VPVLLPVPLLLGCAFSGLLSPNSLNYLLKMNHPNFTESVEITKSAFYLLRGNDEKSWRDYGNNEHAEWTVYINEGVRLLALCNFLSGVTQYYVQDINA